MPRQSKQFVSKVCINYKVPKVTEIVQYPVLEAYLSLFTINAVFRYWWLWSAKMILQIAKIEIEITNQSFEFSANTYLRVCIQIETSYLIQTLPTHRISTGQKVEFIDNHLRRSWCNWTMSPPSFNAGHDSFACPVRRQSHVVRF